MSPTDSRASRDVPSKATLFCPDCGHQGRYDGDWIVVERYGGAHYRCPDCHAELTVRPTHTTGHPTRVMDTYWQAVDRSVRAWRGLWHRLLSP
ncbi:hypothetical protein ACM16X_11960 [Haloarcula japonica]|uniref:hypothetical protein n=1 Tax=Haloarcula japonica TaxID=29282 RepID=UPI0039F65608